MTEQRRSLTDEVRRWSDDQLVGLLAVRADLVSPVPADLGALVNRACAPTSLRRALDTLDAFTLAVVDGLVALGDPATYADLRTALLDPPDAALRAALDRLRGLALVWGDDQRLHLVRALRQVVDQGGGLGPPVGDLLVAYDDERLCALAEDLGLATDRPQTALVAAFADDAWLDDLLASLPAADREVLDALAWGPPAGAVADALRDVRVSSAATPVARLLARGLLVAVDEGTVLLPSEVALRLRAGRLFRTVPVTPPPLATTPLDAAEADRAAAGQAAAFVRHVEEALEAWGVAPPGVLRAGGLGVRDLRRLARDLDLDERHAGLLVETAYDAGLLTATDAWLPTPAYDAWRREPPQRRWLALVEAWLETTRVPGLVGERDERDKPFNALGPDLNHRSAPAMRRRALGVLAALPPGSAASLAGVVDAVAWSVPRLAGTWVRTSLLPWILAEAEVLGVTGRAALASYARRLLDGDRDGAADALAALLPTPVDVVLLQADLTAVAPGPLVAELARELALAADVESKGGATVYRFTPASIRRALDAGRSASYLHALLARHSRTPVPQPLSYLVDDVARRHGRIRVGRAVAYVRCDDPALLDELLATRRLADVRLRRLAPTVLVTPATAERLLEALRGLGHAPAAESPDGALLVEHPDVRRGPPPPRTVPLSYDPPPTSPHLLARAVKALRAGERAAAAGRRATASGSGSRGDVVTTLAVLQDAAADGRPLWISYVNAQGQASQRVVEPLRLARGLLEAYDHLHEEVRTFAVHRITAVAEVDDEPA
ncbi:MAG TPA: helicase C-terminal domain-containing protein [Mycobacteriales bacterium]|nr:helicase C-terminal domain-containing protein [Mycobacteriales bacterium]